MTFSLYAIARSLSWKPRARGSENFSVRRPLHAGEVDPLLVHLVKRGHLPELVDLADHQIRHVVDLLLGVEAAEAEADRRVRQVVADAHGVEDVRRLEA